MARFAPAIARLVSELGKLPGIGTKTAQRLAFHILSLPREKSTALADAILEAARDTRLCSVCCNLTDTDPCEICTSAKVPATSRRSSGSMSTKGCTTYCMAPSPR